jgi:acetyl-CoA C-acetyltransferase
MVTGEAAMASEAFIYDAIRTPRGRGRFDGALAGIKPLHLVTGLLRELSARHGIGGDDVDEIVLGTVNPHGEQGSVLGRIAALVAGWGRHAVGLQVNRFCASGSEAIHLGAAKIAAGHAGLVVAGGVESMSRVPMGSDGGPWAEDIDGAVGGLYVPQGISADIIATLDGMTRDDLDGFALRSHRRAEAASKAGHFARSLVPVRDAGGLLLLDHDELVRHDTTLERLGQLPSAFAGVGAEGFDLIASDVYPGIGAVAHVHTAGNASGIADAAALLLLGTAEAGARHGLKPRGKVAGCAVVGSDPTIMLTGPGPAVDRLLADRGLGYDDVDLFEVNEAFASVALRFLAHSGIDPERMNPNGGAIALGHPLGATGAILTGTLLDELERRDLHRGVVTLCAAGGMAIATLVERV